jgi:hypothetical protein
VTARARSLPPLRADCALFATELSLEPSLRAAVERTTGRTVIAFQSSMNPQHGLILEAFVLAPALS